MSAAPLIEVNELMRENAKLKGELEVAAAKERELRALIAYLNKIGPKPAEMNP